MTRSGYRAPGKNTFVDESLFGNTGTKSTKFLPAHTTGTGPTEVGTTKDSSMRTKLPPVVTLSKSDVDRMLKPSPIMTKESIAAAKKEAEQKREAAQAVSKARKARMLQLEEEAKSRKQPTETELLKTKANAATLSRAEVLQDEELDQVKQMNQMMLYSKCVTIRDAQVEEKRQMMQENEDENRKQDLMMEIERVKALEQYETRERQRKEEQRRGALVLNVQIEERKAERKREEERRDQERIQQLKEHERLKEAELQAAIEKRIANQELMKQVKAANEEQMLRKEAMKVREKEDDQRIAAYVRQKELKEADIQAEKERIAAEKEAECARLRAMQERAADTQSALDELRARRYSEAKEREARAKERAQMERQQASVRDLKESRLAQQHSKLMQQAEMVESEHQDFMRVLAVNRAKEAQELQATARTAEINKRYKEELLAQIQANNEVRMRERQMALEEGTKLQQERAAEQARLEMIKTKKLETLDRVGVPKKYQAELHGYKIKL